MHGTTNNTCLTAAITWGLVGMKTLQNEVSVNFVTFFQTDYLRHSCQDLKETCCSCNTQLMIVYCDGYWFCILKILRFCARNNSCMCA